MFVAWLKVKTFLLSQPSSGTGYSYLSCRKMAGCHCPWHVCFQTEDPGPKPCWQLQIILSVHKSARTSVMPNNKQLQSSEVSKDLNVFHRQTGGLLFGGPKLGSVGFGLDQLHGSLPCAHSCPGNNILIITSKTEGYKPSYLDTFQASTHLMSQASHYPQQVSQLCPAPKWWGHVPTYSESHCKTVDE